MKIREYRLALTGTPEEQAAIKAEGKILPITETIAIPRGPIVRRVNARFLETKQTGIHPQTKQIGTFIVPEECVYLWAEVDDTMPNRLYRFHIIPTGFDVPKDAPYIGTFLLQAGKHVYHVYGPEAVIQCQTCNDTGRVWDNGDRTDCPKCGG